MLSERDRDSVACSLNSTTEMCLCETPRRRRPLITGCIVNFAVRGPALDAMSTRAAVVCVALPAGASILAVLHLVAVKNRQHPLYPCTTSEAKAPVPYMANKIVVAALFMVWSRVGYIDAFLSCCVLAADGSLSCSPAIYHLDSSNIS